MTRTPGRSLLVLGAALIAARAHGAAFTYLATPVDVTPGTAGSWQSVDVSASVPAGATGVILQMVNTSGTNYTYGVRNNGSTDTWMADGAAEKTARSGAQGFCMIGVDAGRIFQCYTENASVKTYLLGYTGGGVTFFTNALDRSPASTAAITDTSLAADTGAATAIGAIFIVKNDRNTAQAWLARKKGSSDNRYTSLQTGAATMALVGLDSSEVCQLEIGNAVVYMKLVGYVTSGAVFFTNGIDKSENVTTGSYVTEDITSSIGVEGASGAFLEFTLTTARQVAVRSVGATHDYYKDLRHHGAITAIDANDAFEQKIENTGMDCFLVGYSQDTVTNFRSVGTNAGTLYSTGTCSITVDTQTLTFGGGASLPSNVGAGDKVTIGSTVFYIRTKDSSTQCTTHRMADATLTNQPYTITRAYNDLQSWETARQGDLVAEDRKETAVLYDDGDFTTALAIDGSTTDIGHPIRIMIASGQYHAGVAGAARLLDMNNTGTGITISDNFVEIDWLQITRTGGANGRSGVYVTNATGVELKGLIIYNYDTGHTCRGVRVGSAGSATLSNVIVYDGGGYGLHSDTGAGTTTALNCVVQGISGVGVQKTAGALFAYNVISMDNTTADFAGGMTAATNMSSDATAPGAGSLTGKYSGNQFVNITAGSEDFHLKAGSDAIDVGTDASAVFTYDIDVEARPQGGGWDIGADERSAGGGANYRSVGTNSATICSTGTCALTGGSTTVTFAGGASLPANIGQGDKLTVGSSVLYLASRDSATQATLQVAASVTASGQTYTIKRAYNDFQSWETARQGDLVTQARSETAVAYDDGDFTSGVVIDGSTTDATHYMGITVASGQRHAGVAGNGAVVDMNNTGTAVDVQDDYTRVEWLQLTRFNGAAGRAGVLVAASNVLVQYVIGYDYNTGHIGAGVRCNSGSVTVRNSTFYRGSSNGLRTGGGTLTAQNCTVGGMIGTGVINVSGTLTATNVMSAANSTADFSGTITQSNNISTDATASGSGSITNQIATNLIVNTTVGSEDVHLKTGSAAINAGADLSASFTDDFDGMARSGTWDIGSDEYTTTTTNYRSIGSDTGTIYSTGVASITSGTSTATFGGGAALPSNIGQGDKLTIGATVFYILSRDSATQATVQETASSTLSSQGYTIKRAYNNLQSWETARQGSLVSEYRAEVGVIYDDGDLTGAVTIDGSTTDSGRYMKLTVASGQRHAGTAGVGAVLDMANGGTGITISDDYTKVEWLQIRRTGGSNGRSAVRVVNATNVKLDDLLVYDFNGASTLYGIRGDTSSGVTVRNCIIYDGTHRALSTDDAAATMTVQNCTVYGITGYGLMRQIGTLTATNTIAMACTTADFSLTVIQSYNMSSDASASGTGSLPSRTASDQFQYVTANNINLHLRAGSAAIDTASDLSGSFTGDVDGGTRGLPWDMGADESGVAGTGQKQTPRVANWAEVAPP